jgi:hypothetical protein
MDLTPQRAAEANSTSPAEFINTKIVSFLLIVTFHSPCSDFAKWHHLLSDQHPAVLKRFLM